MADGFRDYTLTWRKWNMDAPIAEPSRLAAYRGVERRKENEDEEVKEVEDEDEEEEKEEKDETWCTYGSQRRSFSNRGFAL
ncbi:hypothetical protein HZH66_003193 [Vespula vulgaris]|uniref:Uncharacterized protein n=1 Tax=Vespula vulgaris TaxID=7454 RepID=A0A834KMU5_VESVU|nr:hypothetical protein HZH66_003193 [Vespula vulgaris]